MSSEEHTQNGTAPVDPPVIVRRNRSSERFVARESRTPSADGVIVSRNLLGARSKDRRSQTSRERVVAGDLPDWEPMPPGELFVHRPTGA